MPSLRTRFLGAVLCLVLVALMVSVEATALVQGPPQAGSLALPRSTSRAPPPRIGESSGRSNSPSFPTPIRHVVIVMMENHNYSYVLQNGPFEASLANTYATAKNAYSVAHGSIPSYEAAASAFDNHTYPVAAGNIGDLADGASISWDAFEQSMPTPCNRTINRTVGYLPVHNPFIMYDDIVRNATRCQAHDLTGAAWTTDLGLGTLPNYSFFTPNATNDGHTGGQAVSLAEADVWLKSFLPPLINDPAIFSDTAFLVAYDEGDKFDTTVVNGTAGGHVYTVAVSPYSKGLSSHQFYTTFSLLTTAEWLLGLPGGTLGTNDSWAVNPPMKDLFSFPSSTYNVRFSETGLPVGTNWSVTLNGTTKSSTNPTISFSEQNGTYSYILGVVSGYASLPGHGTVTASATTSSVPVSFVLSNPALQGLFGLYGDRPDLQAAFPSAENNTSALFDLVSWAGGAAGGLWPDTSYSTLAPYGYWYTLMRTYNERSDLQGAFPSAYSNLTSYRGLVEWASGTVMGVFTDGAATLLQPFGYYYDLMTVYGGRSDLQSAFPNAYSNETSYDGLVVWAGGLVETLWTDGAYTTLEPYGYWYGLIGTYLGRPDLRAAFPDALTNFTEYQALVVWASEAVAGVFADGAGTLLAPYGYYYDLLAVYGQRNDLQSAFPAAYTNTVSYAELVAWAGGIVTGQYADGANATLQPYGYYYDLLGIYGQRSDLQGAFPQAYSNAASYGQLLTWAKEVVEQVFPDGAYTQLEVYASYYIAHG